MKVLEYGPLNKSLHTQIFELLAKTLVHAPNAIKFTTQILHGKNALITHFGDSFVNVHELIKRTEFNHVSMDIADDQAYKKKLDQIYISHSSSKYDNLTLSEKATLKDYTGSGFVGVNQFLYGKSTNINCKNIDKTLVKIAFLSSALNKMPPETDHFETYRGEHISNQKIQERIDLIHENGGHTQEEAFKSTSEDKSVSQSFGGNVLIHFDHAYGKDVSGISSFPHEHEHLLNPTKVQWYDYELINGKHLFHAKVVAPLDPMRDEVNEHDIETFLQLKEYVSKLGLNTDFLTDHNQSLLEKFDNNQTEIEQFIDNQNDIEPLTATDIFCDAFLDTFGAQYLEDNHSIQPQYEKTKSVDIMPDMPITNLPVTTEIEEPSLIFGI